ncbi:SMC5 [Bugula neritina]|uniref:Structural maintenance of chromosomes protein 5 n=1 Tax=Bugula neritina TaxID=10212 RepID=A0A7J7KD88_BUGNE|nr:SMC5 [Bugula neritina]
MSQSQRRSISSQFDREFVRGAIREIKLKNFLIYDNVEVYPGAHLNVVIGPNATGKSTIVNAICIGLAGKTTILGRAKDLSAYIKNGCSRASIEIELDGGDESNYRIKRILQRGSTTSSSWLINGKSSSQKQVEELVSSLNIQVSNLCQFLPQDRVADFVKMSNTELLSNTMLAANKDLYNIHCQLKVAQRKSLEINTDFSKLVDVLERERSLNAALERDVSNIEEREGYEQKLNNLKEKRPWVEYEEYRRLHIIQKEEKERVEQKYNEAMAMNLPTKQAIDSLKRQQTDKLTEFREIVRLSVCLSETSSLLFYNCYIRLYSGFITSFSFVVMVTVAMATVVGQLVLNQSREVASVNEAIQSYSEKVNDVETTLKFKETQEQTRIKKLEAMKLQIQALEDQIANLEELNLKPEIELCSTEIKQLNTDKHELDEDIRALSGEKESKRLEIIALESELKKLRDVDSQKLNLVRKRDKHTYDAIMWLRAHRNDFQDVIYEPPLMTLNVRDSANAKFVENNIGFNDMKTFICLNAADHEKFYKKVREENRLLINAAVTLGYGPDHYQPPADISQYRQFGFHCYLKDLVEAPNAVLAHLCHLSGLHRIPVGGSRVNDFIDEIPNRCPGVSRYVSDTHTYSYKRSKYGARNVLTRSTDLRPASLLIHSVDESKQEEVNSKLKVLRQQDIDLTNRIKALSDKLAKVDQSLEQARQKKRDLIKKQGERKTVQEKLLLKKESLLLLEQEAVDMDAARADCNRQIEAIFADRLRELSNLADKTEVVMKHCKQRCVLGLQYYSLNQQVKQKEAELAEKSLLLIDLERELSEKKEQLSKTRDIAKRLQNEAKRTTGDMNKFPPEKQKVIKQLPSTLEELDAMIADVQARMDLIYERAARIEKLEKKMAGNNAAQTAHKDEISQLRDSWLPPLQEIIDKVNQQFSSYFRQMKCAGEVTLRVPPNPDEFENYGIGINVKYGDNKPMKELTTFQSGGERSVATVLYMLALQELSKAPFRCVDEINQGMDADNERKVFELVVKAACRPNTPQYFLLTPKLLPDLLYTERMAVHIVHNGPYMVEHSKWNPDSFLTTRREFSDED